MFLDSMTHLTLLLLLQAVGTLKAGIGTVYTIYTYQLQSCNGCNSYPLTLGRYSHTDRSPIFHMHIEKCKRVHETTLRCFHFREKITLIPRSTFRTVTLR